MGFKVSRFRSFHPLLRCITETNTFSTKSKFRGKFREISENLRTFIRDVFEGRENWSRCEIFCFAT